MKVLEVSQSGGPEVLRLGERPVPTFLPSEVLIRVRAAGMNHADIAQRHGVYPPPPGASDLLGLEVAGEIVAIGEQVFQWKVGDRECALMSGGGYAQYATASANLCLPVPKGYSFEQAAVLPEALATVWMNVFMKAGLRTSEKLLVHGGASGVGTTAIQLANSLGAEVWATAGSDEKCRVCESLGAHRAINYKTEDFEKVIREQHRVRMNVVFDMIGGSYFEKNLHILAQEGRLVYISALAGRHVKLDLVDMMKKRISIFGSVLRPLSVPAKAAIVAQMAQVVWPLLESGKVVPVIYTQFPLEHAAEAHILMQSHAHIGKIVLTVQ